MKHTEKKESAEMKRASVTPRQLQEAQRPLSGALKAEGGMQEVFEQY